MQGALAVVLWFSIHPADAAVVCRGAIKLDDLCTYLLRLTQPARTGGPEGAWSVLRLGFQVVARVGFLLYGAMGTHASLPQYASGFFLRRLLAVLMSLMCN